jgi:AAA+ superfamily predicted ATPase
MPESPHPAAIQHEEVDRILSDPSNAGQQESNFYRQDPEAAQLSIQIEEAEKELASEPRWQRLIEVLELSPAEQHLLAIAVAFALEPSLGRVYAYLHDQPEMVQPTPWLSTALFGAAGTGSAVAMSGDSSLLNWRVLQCAPDAMSGPDTLRGWLPNPAIVTWLTRNDSSDLPHGARIVAFEQFVALPQLYANELRVMEEFFALMPDHAPVKLEFELVGPNGSGRLTLSGQFAARRRQRLLAVDAAVLLGDLADTEVPERVISVIRASRLRDLILFWGEGSEPHAVARKVLLEYPGRRIVARNSPLADPLPEDVLFRSVELPPLSRADRAMLWQAISDQTPSRQVRDWMLTPGEIAKIVHVGAAGDEAVLQACRRPAASLNLLVRLPQPFGEKDLIVTKAVEDQLKDFERQIRLRWDVYEDWGFERLCPNGRGIVGLFAGPSGTGKTMAVQVLAKKLGMELYRLDPAQVVNKYIGETEKRLRTIFDECDRAHFMLLIDECEGMFGQRFSSKDAHDRYANLEIDYLLQRLERFQGVAVLATNRKSDLDSGFLRRIRSVIDFLPPGPTERLKLWQSAIPEKSPSGELLRGTIDWELLAEKAPLTGAEIKLAALNAAFLAYGEKKKIGMPYIVASVRQEYAKKGQTLRGLE